MSGHSGKCSRRANFGYTAKLKLIARRIMGLEESGRLHLPEKSVGTFIQS